MIAESIKMPSPDALRSFDADFELVRDNLPYARRYKKADDDISIAKKILKDTREARLDCGRGLHRIYLTESWRKRYDDWGAMCRALRLPRKLSYELMVDSRVNDSLPPEAADAFPQGLSRDEMRTLRIADQDERDATVHEAVATGDAKAAFATLRASLDAASPVPLNEAEAPKQPAADNDLACVKRHGTILFRWFDARGLGAIALKTPLEDLPALAETAPKPIPA
jgi:hypothetical protein